MKFNELTKIQNGEIVKISSNISLTKKLLLEHKINDFKKKYKSAESEPDYLVIHLMEWLEYKYGTEESFLKEYEKSKEDLGIIDFTIDEFMWMKYCDS